jgi:hypothetical protein
MDTDKETDPALAGEDCRDVGDLACRIKRFTRQSEVAAESQGALEGMQEKYDAASAAYFAAQTAVRADVKAAKDQLARIYDVLKCTLEADRDCMHKAVDKVFGEIDKCGAKQGRCRVGPCNFDTNVGADATASELAGRIDEYRREAANAVQVFDDLIAHPQQIPSDVAGIKGEVERLSEEVRADGNRQPERFFASYLVLEKKLEGARLWHGFETSKDYMDCLCRALGCAFKGWEAVIVLEGSKAEIDCRDEAKKAECARKQTNVLQDVLAEFEKCRQNAEVPKPQNGGGNYQAVPRY